MNNDIEVKRYICSDINNDMIDFFNNLKSDVNNFIDSYTSTWNDLNKYEYI